MRANDMIIYTIPSSWWIRPSKQTSHHFENLSCLRCMDLVASFTYIQFRAIDFFTFIFWRLSSALLENLEDVFPKLSQPVKKICMVSQKIRQYTKLNFTWWVMITWLSMWYQGNISSRSWRNVYSLLLVVSGSWVSGSLIINENK